MTGGYLNLKTRVASGLLSFFSNIDDLGDLGFGDNFAVCLTF